AEEILLDLAMKDQAGNRRRQKSDREVPDESPALLRLGRRANQLEKPGSVDPHNRQNGAQLDEDFECLGPFSLKAKQRPGDNEMSGGRDGQELGDPLDQAEDHGSQIAVEHHLSVSAYNASYIGTIRSAEKLLAFSSAALAMALWAVA